MNRPKRRPPIQLALIALCAVLVGLGCVRPTGTNGPRIGSYPAPRTALLVIDLQEDYTGPNAKQRYRDADRIVAAANGLLAKAGTDGDLVVFIENVETGALVHLLTGGLNAPGAPGTDMDHRLLRPSGTRIFTKENPDAFSNREFDAYLRDNRVNHLVIAGLDAAVCVSATLQGALNRGYKVTMATPAITTNAGNGIGKWAQRWREAGAEVN
jgi:nicotinamidase-related amidase